MDFGQDTFYHVISINHTWISGHGGKWENWVARY